jgi:hypothetical protein
MQECFPMRQQAHLAKARMREKGMERKAWDESVSLG